MRETAAAAARRQGIRPPGLDDQEPGRAILGDEGELLGRPLRVDVDDDGADLRHGQHRGDLGHALAQVHDHAFARAAMPGLLEIGRDPGAFSAASA